MKQAKYNESLMGGHKVPYRSDREVQSIICLHIPFIAGIAKKTGPRDNMQFRS